MFYTKTYIDWLQKIKTLEAVNVEIQMTIYDVREYAICYLQCKRKSNIQEALDYLFVQ